MDTSKNQLNLFVSPGGKAPDSQFLLRPEPGRSLKNVSLLIPSTKSDAQPRAHLSPATSSLRNGRTLLQPGTHWISVTFLKLFCPWIHIGRPPSSS